MPKWAVRVAIWGPLLIAGLLAGAYVYMHGTFARDGTELLQVPLSEEEPELDRVGELRYLGGLDIPRMGENVGGLSGLRWDAPSERLLAITDDARWVWITLEENGERLTGIDGVEVGNLLGPEGEVLTGKERGDSESLTRSTYHGWLVGFERDHRIWHYRTLTGPAASALQDPDVSLQDPQELLGPLDSNNGVEGMAGNELVLIACAERAGTAARPNCTTDTRTNRTPLMAVPPQAVARLGGVPTDMDAGQDSTIYILFRSYSPTDGNSAAVVAYHPDGSRRELLTLRPPLTVDNFEGLAVREEEGRTFLYIVSDDNFSGNQRTLLMKFEVLPEAE